MVILARYDSADSMGKACPIVFSRIRFLFRELSIDQSIGRFAFEAGEYLLDGAELKGCAGLLAEPGGVSRHDYSGMAHERTTDRRHAGFRFQDIERRAGN